MRTAKLMTRLNTIRGILQTHDGLLSGIADDVFGYRKEFHPSEIRKVIRDEFGWTPLVEVLEDVERLEGDICRLLLDGAFDGFDDRASIMKYLDSLGRSKLPEIVMNAREAAHQEADRVMGETFLQAFKSALLRT